MKTIQAVSDIDVFMLLRNGKILQLFCKNLRYNRDKANQ